MYKYHNKGVIHLSNPILSVNSLVDSISFYEKVLDFKVLKKEGKTVELGTNKNTLLTLYENKEHNKKNNSNGLYHIAYLLPTRSDLASFLYHLIKKDIKIIGASNHGASEAIYLEDIDGHGIEVYSDFNDESLNELVTKRLDVNDLFSINFNKEKFELNDDTMIGHIHFSSNNINESLNYFQNIIGFKLLLNLRSAIFLSDNNYHHHIGVNVWKNQINTEDDPNNLKLLGYTLNIPKVKKDSFIKRLNKAGIKLFNDEKNMYYYDMFNCKVIVRS